MASLIEKSVLDGLLPLTAGGATISERRMGPITSIAPFVGTEAKVAARLKGMGLDWPMPNRAVAKGDAACVWTGRGQAFLIGVAPPDIAGLAALSDQSDGWAAMTLAGPASVDVLARLVPVDLRLRAFPVGQVARTGLNHMMSILWRRSDDSIDVMVFRSMAKTAVHELHDAMKMVAARAAV